MLTTIIEIKMICCKTSFKTIWIWWYVPITPAVWMWQYFPITPAVKRQVGHSFETSMGYIVRLQYKKTKQKEKEKNCKSPGRMQTVIDHWLWEVVF